MRLSNYSVLNMVAIVLDIALPTKSHDPPSRASCPGFKDLDFRLRTSDLARRGPGVWDIGALQSQGGGECAATDRFLSID